jgi:transcriptional regulator with XRE-family HTH domain
MHGTVSLLTTVCRYQLTVTSLFRGGRGLMIVVSDHAETGSLDHSALDPAGGRTSKGAPTGPTVRRIGLGGALRRRREAAGVTRERAGEAIRASSAKISRLELGRVGFKERDVADLLTCYGVRDPAEREQFLDLARQTNTPGWWHRYSDLLPSWFETYLGLEQAASVIRNY